MSTLTILIADLIEAQPALSDIFLDTGKPAGFKGARGFEVLEPQSEVTKYELTELLKGRYGNDLVGKLKEQNGRDDFSLPVAGHEFRAALRSVNAGEELSLTLRLIRDTVPHYTDLGLPVEVGELVRFKNGLVLFTGQTNSGKSFSQAALISHYASTIAGKVVTLEDPIEYRARDNKSRVIQKEVGVDVMSFRAGIVDAMRESPNMLMVGEIRDQDTLIAAMQGAEAGQLVFATLHTNNFEATVDRVCDLLSGAHVEALRKTFASVLRGVISQVLVPSASGLGRCLAHEIVVPPADERAIQTLIRKGELQQLNEQINKRRALMHVLNDSLQELVQAGKVHREDALDATYDRDGLAGRLG